MLAKASSASSGLPGSLPMSCGTAEHKQPHPPHPPSPGRVSSPQPGLLGARRVLLAHTATTRSLVPPELSLNPLHPFKVSESPQRSPHPPPPLLPAKGDTALHLLPPHPRVNSRAGKGLRSWGGGVWSCSRDQGLVSSLAISHSVLLRRVCLNNLAGRLINQVLAFVCQLKAEIVIRRSTRHRPAQPPFPARPAPSLPLPLSPSPSLSPTPSPSPFSLLPDSAALGCLVIYLLPLQPCSRSSSVHASPALQFPLCRLQ